MCLWCRRDMAAAKAARARAARRLLRHAREGDFIQNLPVSLLRQCFDQWEAAAGHPWRPDQFPLLAPGGNGCSHQSADAAQMPQNDTVPAHASALIQIDSDEEVARKLQERFDSEESASVNRQIEDEKIADSLRAASGTGQKPRRSSWLRWMQRRRIGDCSQRPRGGPEMKPPGPRTPSSPRWRGSVQLR